MSKRRPSSSEYLSEWPTRGTRRSGGYRKLCAYIATKALGRLTPATGTSEASSSLRVRIDQWVDVPMDAQTLIRHALSSGTLGWSTGATATRGVSGERPTLADWIEAVEAYTWDRANREALGG